MHWGHCINRQVHVLTEVILQWGRTINGLTNDVRYYKEKQSKTKDDTGDSCHVGKPRKGTVAVTMCRNWNEARESAMQRSGKGQFEQEKEQVHRPQGRSKLGALEHQRGAQCGGNNEHMGESKRRGHSGESRPCSSSQEEQGMLVLC